MCDNNDREKELIVVEESQAKVPEKAFPLCLLDKNSYIGIKGLFGILFWFALIKSLYELEQS